MENKPSSPLFLGIDLGTSGCRGIIINQQQEPVAAARASYPSSRRDDIQYEQNPGDWWHALCEVIEQLSSQVDYNNIAAIAIDGTSGTVMLCDEHGTPLHPALMYNDSRASQEAEHLARFCQQHNIDNAATASASSGLAKLLWLQKQPYTHKARYLLHQADWINGKLLKRFGDSDVNNALKTGYDVINQQWPAWFKQLGINSDWLPQVHQPGEELGTINHEVARQLGLSPETRIVAGTTDSTAAIMATGANEVGEAITSLGSTLVIKVIVDKPVSNSDYGVYSQPFGKYWLAGGASNTGGAVLQQYFDDEQLQSLTTQLNPQQNTGIEYYPLPSRGERFPFNDPDKCSCVAPRPEDDVIFFQALLESMARIEQQGYKRLQQLGAPYPTKVLSCGGGASNQAWLKIRQNYLCVPVSKSEQQEAAFGMALLAKRSSKIQ